MARRWPWRAATGVPSEWETMGDPAKLSQVAIAPPPRPRGSQLHSPGIMDDKSSGTSPVSRQRSGRPTGRAEASLYAHAGYAAVPIRVVPEEYLAGETAHRHGVPDPEGNQARVAESGKGRIDR